MKMKLANVETAWIISLALVSAMKFTPHPTHSVIILLLGYTSTQKQVPIIYISIQWSWMLCLWSCKHRNFFFWGGGLGVPLATIIAPNLHNQYLFSFIWKEKGDVIEQTDNASFKFCWILRRRPIQWHDLSGSSTYSWHHSKTLQGRDTRHYDASLFSNLVYYIKLLFCLDILQVFISRNFNLNNISLSLPCVQLFT